MVCWVLPDLPAQQPFLLEMINSKTVQASSKHRVRELEVCFAESGKPGVILKLGGRQPVLNKIWGMLSHPFTCEWESVSVDSHGTGFTVLGKGRQRLLGQLLSQSLLPSSAPTVLCLKTSTKEPVEELFQENLQ